MNSYGFIVEAFVAVGGNPDKSGSVASQMLIKTLRDEF